MEFNNSYFNNRVYLSGRVAGILEFSHCLYGEDFFKFYLCIERLSGAFDLLPITISSRALSFVDVCQDEYISIIGQLRSYNKLVDGVSRLILTVFAHSIDYCDENERCNTIEITGYVCKEPIYRKTPFNREIADLLFAVNRAFNKSDYIPCIAWGKNARFAKELPVGEKIFATGRVQSREYQKTLLPGETITRVAYEVSISTLETIE